MRNGVYLVHTICKDALRGSKEAEKELFKVVAPIIYLRVKVTKGAKYNFSYSVIGKAFIATGEEFIAEAGRWKGAKVGLFCTRQTEISISVYAGFDWFRVEPTE